MNGQAVIFLILVINQLAAVVTFIGVYGLRSPWRETAIGRHMMFWSVTSGVLDLCWLLLLVAQKSWLVYALLGAQALVGLLTWQRVWLVWKAQRR